MEKSISQKTGQKQSKMVIYNKKTVKNSQKIEQKLPKNW